MIGIAASGTTPYVIGGLQACNENNIITGSISCSSASTLPYSPDEVAMNFSTTSADVNCNLNWQDYSDVPPGEEIGGAGMSVFPNPCLQIFHVVSQTTVSEIILTDVTGRTIVSEKLNGKTLDVDTQGLAAGVYFLTLNSDGKEFNKKIIKQ